MNGELDHQVRLRADGRCEYCGLPERLSPIGFLVSLVRARVHGGEKVLQNLVLTCPECQFHRGSNLATLDPPGTGEMVSLYHPRKDVWATHFKPSGAEIVGLTGSGRGTAFLLRMNHGIRLDLRQSLLNESIVGLRRTLG